MVGRTGSPQARDPAPERTASCEWRAQQHTGQMTTVIHPTVRIHEGAAVARHINIRLNIPSVTG